MQQIIGVIPYKLRLYKFTFINKIIINGVRYLRVNIINSSDTIRLNKGYHNEFRIVPIGGSRANEIKTVIITV